MHLVFGLPALTLLSIASVVGAQECPAGYAPISSDAGTSTTISPTQLSSTIASTTSDIRSTTSLTTILSSTSVSTSDDGSTTFPTTTSASTTTTSDEDSTTSQITTTVTTTTTSDDGSTSSSTTTSSTTSSTSASATTIVWQACGQGTNEPTLQCGTIMVPLDYTASGRKRDVEMLTLPVVRIPAKNANPRGLSIIYNPGGPGVSGINDIVTSGSTLQTTIGDDWHLVSFDPRGVGLNRPYKCTNVTPVAGSGESLDTDTGINAAYTNSVNQGQFCADNYKTAGELLGTAFVARDINAIAQALGEDGLIRYWGFSYGTLLGATLSAMFPLKMDRIVLDGNINPTDYYHGLSDESVADVDAAVLNFFNTCQAAGSTNCALATTGATGQQLLDTFQKFLDGLSSGGISAKYSDGSQAYYVDVLGLITGQIKSPDTTKWKKSAQTIADLYKTSVSTAGSRLRRRQTSTFNPVAPKADLDPPQALYAVACGDWDLMSGVTVDKFKAWLKLYKTRSKYASDDLIGLLYSCATWKIDAKEKYKGLFQNIATKNPILYVQSPFDPVTPMISARNSSSGFVGAKLLVHNGAGHCSSSQPSECTAKKVKDYFDTGILPDVSQACQPDLAMFKPAPVGNQRRDTDAEAFSKAVADLKNIHHVRDVKFTYPDALDAANRDVFDLLSRREIVPIIPPGCTPIVSSSTTTTSTIELPSISPAETTTGISTGISTEADIGTTTTTDVVSSTTILILSVTSSTTLPTSNTFVIGPVDTSTTSTLSNIATTTTGLGVDPFSPVATSSTFSSTTTTMDGLGVDPFSTLTSASSELIPVIMTTAAGSGVDPLFTSTPSAFSTTVTNTDGLGVDPFSTSASSVFWSTVTTTASFGVDPLFTSSPSALSSTVTTTGGFGVDAISQGTKSSSGISSTVITTGGFGIDPFSQVGMPSSSTNSYGAVSSTAGFGTSLFSPVAQPSTIASSSIPASQVGPVLFTTKATSTVGGNVPGSTNSVSTGFGWDAWDLKSSSSTASSIQSPGWVAWDPKTSSTTSAKPQSTGWDVWTSGASMSTKAKVSTSSAASDVVWEKWTTTTKFSCSTCSSTKSISTKSTNTKPTTSVISKPNTASKLTNSAGGNKPWSSVAAPVPADSKSSATVNDGAKTTSSVVSSAGTTSWKSSSSMADPTGTKAVGSSTTSSVSIVKPWTGDASHSLVPSALMISMMVIFIAVGI